MAGLAGGDDLFRLAILESTVFYPHRRCLTRSVLRKRRQAEAPNMEALHPMKSQQLQQTRLDASKEENRH